MSLVRHGLGVAVIDEFSVAGVYMPGLTRIPIVEPTEIRIYGVTKRNRSLSAYADFTMARLREELRLAVRNRPWEGGRREQHDVTDSADSVINSGERCGLGC